MCVCVCLPLLCEVLAGSVPPQLQRFALGLVLRLLSMVLLITASHRAWNAHKDSLILESISLDKNVLFIVFQEFILYVYPLTNARHFLLNVWFAFSIFFTIIETSLFMYSQWWRNIMQWFSTTFSSSSLCRRFSSTAACLLSSFIRCSSTFFLRSSSCLSWNCRDLSSLSNHLEPRAAAHAQFSSSLFVQCFSQYRI